MYRTSYSFWEKRIMHKLVDTLNTVFGFDSFYGKQEQVIQAVLDGHSALAVFPTGGGKSLCYQLPALLLPGLTLVVSPLIALMKDQIDFLVSRGVDAARFDSSLDTQALAEVRDRLRAGSLKLLYVSPERLSNERFVTSLRNTKISLMVIDEAHCISEWGHNFRPDYLKLVQAAKRLHAECVLALTATATPKVGQDICRTFVIAEENWFQDSFHRQNLELHLSPCLERERLPLLLTRIKERSPGATIVYVTLQRTAEWVARALSEQGYAAEAYHAGMEGETRHAIQDRFMGGKDRIVVATIAFGMGIDKADIRYVYHFNLPKSLENYAQEIGRAGRDGEPAICEVLVCPQDRTVLENFTYGDTPTKEAVAAVLQEVLMQTGEFHIAPVAMSREHDIRPLVLATLLTWLELKGFIVATGNIPAEVRFQTQRSSGEILDNFDPERAQFLAHIFTHVTKGTKWLNLDMFAAAEAMNEDPKRILRALNYLDEQGMIHLETKRFRKTYRMEQQPASMEQVLSECMERFQQRESADTERLQQVLSLAEHEGCRVVALLAYFGEILESERCGHCDTCLGHPVRPLPPLEAAVLDGNQLQKIATLASEEHPALAQPRQMARFLCGLNSPATTRDRLTKHEVFGSLEQIPFHDILTACEACSEGKT